MCLWPSSNDGHSSPTSRQRGFKAPQAYRGQHYHVLSVCTGCSATLMLIGRLLLSGLELCGVDSAAQSSPRMNRDLICPLQELVMSNLPEI
ncbi:hypothetical protein CgunFtcFv8_014547 [Champsocephalus gunnari]|uniref:Uncharacterized protein n=1 Tax=Champsocephalus gunnari TaxID=52237 RepID=A0AAN8E6R3_CHAGU|nr:hypothetical protein CgunFtcFv8_014547 [Champsocephalus gunnari]